MRAAIRLAPEKSFRLKKIRTVGIRGTLVPSLNVAGTTIDWFFDAETRPLPKRQHRPTGFGTRRHGRPVVALGIDGLFNCPIRIATRVRMCHRNRTPVSAESEIV